MDALELVAHPARLRIVHALRGGRTMTTTELFTRMPDISKAMIYRHVEALAAAGVLEIAQEQRVRGAVERYYRLRVEQASISDDVFATTSIDEHRQIFATAMAVLVSEFTMYLGRKDADPVEDLVGYRQHALWLDHDELERLIADLRQAIVPHLGNKPTPGRGRYLLSPILFPVEDSPRTA